MRSQTTPGKQVKKFAQIDENETQTQNQQPQQAQQLSYMQNQLPQPHQQISNQPMVSHQEQAMNTTPGQSPQMMPQQQNMQSFYQPAGGYPIPQYYVPQGPYQQHPMMHHQPPPPQPYYMAQTAPNQGIMHHPHLIYPFAPGYQNTYQPQGIPHVAMQGHHVLPGHGAQPVYHQYQQHPGYPQYMTPQYAMPQQQVPVAYSRQAFEQLNDPQSRRANVGQSVESTPAITTPHYSSLSTSFDQHLNPVPLIKEQSQPKSISGFSQVQPTDAYWNAGPGQQQPARPNNQEQRCRVVINVNCTTNLNQRVAVIGSDQSLGAWDVNKALILSTNDEKYPIWTGTIELFDSAPIAEYKFIKLTTYGSMGEVQIEWESIFQNRVLDSSIKARLVIEEVFGESKRVNEAFVNRAMLQSITPQTSVQSQGPVTQTNLSTKITVGPLETLKSQIQTPVLQNKQPEMSKSTLKNDGAQTFDNLGQNTMQEEKVEVMPQIEPIQEVQRNNTSCRKLIRQQLEVAFPHRAQIMSKLLDKKQKKKKNGHDSDTTSNASETIRGSLTSSFGGNRRKSLLFAKKLKPKSVKLDPNEVIVQVTHQLPYRLISREQGHFTVETCYQSPALLYASLDELAQTKTYNFVWVGIVVTKHALTRIEEEKADKVLLEKSCFAIYYTEEQINAYMRFYESLIRPNMHNFVDPADQLKSAVDDWAAFKAVNAAVARKVQQVRQEKNSKTIWIHGDQFMLVPYYVRQSEKGIKANIGFYFHQAFPASAVFQSFFKREELLQSLLHSDLIGFHIWEYARNFINSCQRLLGLYYELGEGNTLSVNYNKRSVQVRIQHIGLDEDFVEKIISSQKFASSRQKITNTVKNAMVRDQRNVQPSLSRGNLNMMLLSNQRSVSQPMLLGSGFNAARQANSITSTLASSFADSSDQGINDAMQGKIILASIDSFHQLTGISLKLKGYYNFLKVHPEYRDKVVLFQVIRGLFLKSENMKGEHPSEESKQGQGRASANQNAMLLTDSCESLKQLNTDIIKLVNQIRNEFGRQCLIVESGNWTIEMRLALWSKAQVLFVSTLKDGLYLTCFEYIFVKYLCRDFQNSAMILSEFTGCNSQFAGFYDFNPFQIKTTVAALDRCLKDSPEEKEGRMKRAFKYCRQRTFRGWVENFLKELKLAYDPHNVDDTRILFQGLQAVQYDKSSLSHQSYEKNHMPILLDIKKFALQAISQRKNLIMIDHEALPFKQLGRSEMCPRQVIIHSIQEILYDKNNIVVIFSDRHRNYVQTVFEQNLMEQENFWVAAESGYWLMTNKGQWTELFKVQSKQWMQTVREIMAEYCENIDGAVVEERSCTVVWNYKNAEEEHGSKFANELAQHLQHLIGRHSPIEIVHGNGFIEVLPKKLNKRAVLKNIFSHLQLYSNHQIESLLYIGADLSGNSTFQFIKSRIEEDKQKSKDHISPTVENGPLFAANCKQVLCVLSNRPSLAQYFLEQKDVQYLLQEMAFKTQSRKRTKSSTNLLEDLSEQQQLNRRKGSLAKLQTNVDINDSFDNAFGKENVQKTPPRKKLSNRNLSHTCLFQPSMVIDKSDIYDAIPETMEEDNMTQLSEYQQFDKDPLAMVIEQLSGQEGSSSVRKNISAEQISLQPFHSQINCDLNGIFEGLGASSSRDLQSLFYHRRASAAGHQEFLLPQSALSIETSEHANSGKNRNEPRSPLTVANNPAEMSMAIEVGKTHESASMPQLKTQDSAPNKTLYRTDDKSGQCDSARAMNGKKTNSIETGGGSGNQAHYNSEINLESMDGDQSITAPPLPLPALYPAMASDMNNTLQTGKSSDQIRPDTPVIVPLNAAQNPNLQQ